MMLPYRLFLVAVCFALGACASIYGARDRAPANAEASDTFEERPVAGCGADESAFDCDRRAILAMLGEYKVSFAFDETAVLAPGYRRRAPQRSGGYETVVLVEDAGTRIDLQHILVVGGGMVVKHWRQTWEYEADPIWRFRGDQIYAPEARAAGNVAGTWTQSVYEVSDAPRYAGSGRWNHRYGVSTWTSDRTWRPLPRREYTKRDDYQLLNVENRHTITPQGWTHEQDNTKVQRDAQGRDTTLVREFGFNDYRRVRGHDFSPAYTYWSETARFWGRVRARWQARLAAPNGVRLAYPTDDEKFIEAMFEAADAWRESRDVAGTEATLDRLFAASVLDGAAPPLAAQSER
jgi:hypothetical protein